MPAFINAIKLTRQDAINMLCKMSVGETSTDAAAAVIHMCRYDSVTHAVILLNFVGASPETAKLQGITNLFVFESESEADNKIALLAKNSAPSFEHNTK